MTINPSPIEGLCTIEPSRIADERGHFYRVFCKKEFAKHGVSVGELLQINHSFNKKAGTFRGFHFQYPPFAEEKLIRCTSGRVWDVAIDIRKDSPTFLQSFGTELSEENGRMIVIPKGFAHGFITLTDNACLTYHHTAYYESGHEGGLSINDPILQIHLPKGIQVISERDQNHPYLTTDFKGIAI